MCGVFGFIADGSGKLNLNLIERIARVTERRGPDAFGFAWIDRHGKIHAFKQTGRISHALPILAMAADARMLIGHCRYATHGDFRSNINNHPHPCDGGWIVHNGTLPRYELMIEDYNLLPVGSCDSEVLALLVEKFTGKIAHRCAKAVEAIAPDAGHQPLVMLGLWSRPNRLTVVRRGNPLHWSRTSQGIYIASLAEGMPGKPAAVRDGSVHVFTKKGECKFQSLARARQVA